MQLPKFRAVDKRAIPGRKRELCFQWSGFIFPVGLTVKEMVSRATDKAGRISGRPLKGTKQLVRQDRLAHVNT